MTSNISDKIQQFYDASSSLWERIWGEHMHHGYYGPTGREKKDRRQAQIDLIEEVLDWAGVKEVNEIIDVGCGIGGSSLYLAQKYNANVSGITLSPVQALRARERSAQVGLDGRVQCQVADALNMPFADNSFDLIWSMESGEHMPDKERFMGECYRVLKPEGIFLMATWCHRPITPATGKLTREEQDYLAEIYRVYCLPYTISLPDYARIARNLNLKNVSTADWSDRVEPFWDIVIDSALNLQAILGLVQSGWTTIEAALSLGLMSRGYRRGLIRYGLLCGRK